MDKTDAVIAGLVIGVVPGYFGGYGLSLWAAGVFDPYLMWLARWGPTCGYLTGGYVGGLVGYLLAVRRKRA
jgi:hypothetical protein